MTVDELFDKYMSKAERRMPSTWEDIERFVSGCKEDMIKNDIDDVTITEVVKKLIFFIAILTIEFN